MPAKKPHSNVTIKKRAKKERVAPKVQTVKRKGDSVEKAAFGDGERQREALRRVMTMKNVSAAEWARAAGLRNANQIYNFQAKRSSHLSFPIMQRLAAVYEDVDLLTLAGDASSMQRKVRRMTVKMIARLGDWRDTVDSPLDEQYDISMPDNVDGNFAVRVVGEHANVLLPDDSHVIIEDVDRFLGAFYSGMWVLVRRNRGRQIEITLRKLEMDRGKWWLVVRSRSPDLSIPSVEVPFPYEGQLWTVGNERYQILGVATDAAHSLLERPMHIIP